MNNLQISASVSLLKMTQIFDAASDDELREAALLGEIVLFQRGEKIFSENAYYHSLGLILSGKAEVTKGSLIMSTLSKGEIFGAITLFGDFDYYVTEITAAVQCRVLFLDKATISGLMEKNIKIAQNYIAYLSGRIYFLNERIDAFTAGTASNKLRKYLMDNSTIDENGVKVFTPHSFMELAKKLDLGRASLYRAIDELCNNDELEKSGKTLVLK